MFICSHVYDVALCGSTGRNAALGFLTGWPPLFYAVAYAIFFRATCDRFRTSTRNLLSIWSCLFCAARC